MSSKSEDWWEGNFQKYSIRDYQSLSAYLKFKKCSSPFSRGDSNFREAYWRDQNCYIYEWYDRSSQKGEKFGLDYNSYTYFYEHWFLEDSVHIVIKSWFCDPVEWGVVIKYYPDFEESQSWTVDRESKILETQKVHPEKKESVKFGKKYTDKGLEDFTEKFWETKAQSAKEVSWKRGNVEGQEKRFTEGDKSWGETWEEDGPNFKKENWEEAKGNGWGKESGKQGDEEWERNWEKKEGEEFEETVKKNGEKKWGNVRSVSSEGRFNVDWEGERPEVIGGKLSKPKTSKLRSSRPAPEPLRQEDQKAVDEAVSFERSQGNEKIARIFKDLKEDTRKKIESFGDFLLTPKELDSLSNVSRAVEELPSDSPLESIQGLRRLNDELDQIQKSLTLNLPGIDQIDSAFSDLTATASSLHSVIDPNGQTDTKVQLGRLQKEYEVLEKPRDKFALLAQITPMLKRLTNFQSQNTEEFDRKTAEITEVLSKTLKDFEEVIKESQETLNKVKETLRENDEGSSIIENAYSERGKKLINDIETLVPYTKTLPQLADLLRDMERFKREILENKIAEEINQLVAQQQALSNDLLNGLQSLPLPEDPEKPKDIFSALRKLGKTLDLNRALSGKLIGKNLSVGDELVDSIKPLDPSERIDFDVKELVKVFWLNGQTDHATSGNTLKRLSDSFGTDSDKSQTEESLQRTKEILTGVVPDSNHEALHLLKSTIEEYFPLKVHQSELLDELTQKCESKLKSSELKPETLEEAWKSLLLSDKIAEKILSLDNPNSKSGQSLEEARKAIDSLPAKPEIEPVLKAILRILENSLGTLNNDENATAEELKDLQNSAKQRAGGRGKAIQNKGKKVLRSGKGIRRLNVSEPATDLIAKSLSTTSELALWVIGSRPGVVRHIEELHSAKEPVIKAIQENGGSEEAIDGVFNFLSQLETEKNLIYSKGDLEKSLSQLVQKSLKVLNSASSLLKTPVSEEVKEVENKPLAGDLSDLIKRIGFYLNQFFKIVKDATGVDDGDEHIDDAMTSLLKKNVVSLLPFDPLHLLDELKSKNSTDLRRLQFLAGLVGSDDEVRACQDLENRAKAALNELEPRDNQEAMVNIDHYLHSFPAIEKEITSETERMLSVLLEKLTNPEPTDKEVGALVSAIERLDLSLKLAGEDPEYLELNGKKEKLPTQPESLLPYLTQLVDDYSKRNLDLAGKGKVTNEELANVRVNTAKKLKAAPVLMLRDIKGLFSGPDVESSLNLIVKLDKAADVLLVKGSAPDKDLHLKCKEGVSRLAALTPCEVKELARDYSTLIISIILSDKPVEEYSQDIEETVSGILARRRERATISVITWGDVFKSRGLDLDSALILETIKAEQDFAKVYIQALANTLGTHEQRNQAKSILQRSAEILKAQDEAAKIQNYVQARLEQSRLLQSLTQKYQNLCDRLSSLDSDRAVTIGQIISQIQMLIEKKPNLRSQLEVLASKEQSYVAQSSETLPESVLRLTGRLALEKELYQIRDEAMQIETTDAELLNHLTNLESQVYSSLRTLCQSFADLSSELKPTDVSSLRSRLDQGVSSSIPSVIASLQSTVQFVQDLSAALSSLSANPVKSAVLSSIDLLKTHSNQDDTETENVFSGLFRLVGSAEDKAKSKQLRENRLLINKDESKLIDLSSILAGHLEKFLPVRLSQSAFQGKLVKDIAALRDSVDDVDSATEDILNKALREVANTIPNDDSRSKGSLDSIRKDVDSVNEANAVNIPEILEKVVKRLANWEKLERLRKDLREKLSKEINRLKAEIQDKAAELENAKANLEGVRTQYEAQVTILQNSAEQHSALIEKLTQEALDKEAELSNWKNKSNDLSNLTEEQKEEIQKLQDDNDFNSKELRNLRRNVKDRESRIRELEEKLEDLERKTENTSLGDKEKSGAIDKLKEDIRLAREEAAQTSKNLEEAEEKVSKLEREKQKTEADLAAKDKEVEAAKKEKSGLKARVLQLETEKAELTEKNRLASGSTSDEIKNLERLLEDKHQEIEDLESDLVTAKRYQLLYIELVTEKQELEEQKRELDLELSNSKLKSEELKQENEQLKYKTRQADQAQKDLSQLQKENQKLQVRLDFLEKANEQYGEISELSKKLSEDLISKDTQISDLNSVIESLNSRIKALIEKHNVSLSRSFLIRLCHAFKAQEGLAYRKWKSYKKTVPTKFEIQEAGSQIHDEKVNSFEDDYKAADDVIRQENQQLVEKNTVLALYQSIENKGDKALSVNSFFKFMEEVLDKKFDSVKRDVAESKPIRTLQEFLPDYLNKTLGTQSLAAKFLAQMIPTLHNLCNEGQKYGLFFARLLNMFHAEPYAFALSLYLVKVRMEFVPLTEKYVRTMTEPPKKGEKKKAINLKGSFEWASSGGMALLGDAIELVYQLFTGDKEAGLKALELLKPEKVSYEDFVAYKICHKMAKMGKTPEMIFKLLDKDGGGTIDTNEFLTGTEGDLELWISDSNVKKLMDQLAEGKEEVSKEAFMGKISMKSLMQWNKDPTFAVSKASFMNALAEVHKFKHRKLAAQLNIEYKKIGKDGLDVKEFGQVVTGLDSTLSHHEVEKMFVEARKEEKKVNLSQLIKVASKYGLGDVKSFKVMELIQELNRRKDVLSLIMGETKTEEQAQAQKKMIKSFLGRK